MVIELPPGPLIGLVNDHHQSWVLDMGLPGPDAGKGGKHLVLPPGDKGTIPAGYYTGQSQSLKALVAIRAMPAGVAGAMHALRTIKIYPLIRLQSATHPVCRHDRQGDGCHAAALGGQHRVLADPYRVISAEPLVPQFISMHGLLSELASRRASCSIPMPA